MKHNIQFALDPDKLFLDHHERSLNEVLHCLPDSINVCLVCITEDDKPLVGVDNIEDDDEDDNEENQIQKYRSLLQSLDDDKNRKKKKEVEMEVTWEPGE